MKYKILKDLYENNVCEAIEQSDEYYDEDFKDFVIWKDFNKLYSALPMFKEETIDSGKIYDRTVDNGVVTNTIVYTKNIMSMLQDLGFVEEEMVKNPITIKIDSDEDLNMIYNAIRYYSPKIKENGYYDKLFRSLYEEMNNRGFLL